MEAAGIEISLATTGRAWLHHEADAENRQEPDFDVAKRLVDETFRLL
jgi:hypothetical protein